MRCEIVAVGTELLLGHVVDTNSAWLAEHLAAAGIDSHFRTVVGDNQDRIAEALRTALARSDAVIACGGLGPTPDDITREAVAEVMGVALQRDAAMVARIRGIFAARDRAMAPSNERQADVPLGAVVIPQERGTAPGLICPVGDKVMYAVPGVPHEMREMVERAVLPDLRARAGTRSTIVSRALGTWGLSESELAEVVAPRLRALDANGANPTIAFLARGVEGIKIRVTAKAATDEAARAMVDAEHDELRRLLGPVVFGTDEETMECAAGKLLEAHGLSLGLAESMTGGLAASRVVDVEGSSRWFRGAVVSYQADVKFEVLGVREGPVVAEETARQMAEGACKVLGADVGLSVTGVAGPVEHEGKAVGTTYFGVCLDGRTDVTHSQLAGDRERVRQLAVITLFDLLRRRLLDRDS